MCKHVVIIGSGLGGLSCGVVLAKNGYRVTVLEQGTQVGGCLQCFTRQGVKYETGMHFIGSASKGQTLHRLMHFLEITDKVQLSPLDPLGYDVIDIDGRRYPFAMGREAFIDQLSQHFPNQRHQLERYFDLVKQVSRASSLHSLRSASKDIFNTEYQLRSVNEVVESIIDDPLLARVLVGNLPLYAGERDKTPFATHAFIMDFYNESAYRIVGGSDTVAHALLSVLERYGGRVFTRKRVTRIECDERRATSVLTTDGERIEADIIISDAHPMRTMEMLESPLIRPAFRRRIKNIPQTVGGFSVYLHFRNQSMPYMNHNYYGYECGTPWGCEHYDAESWPKGFLYMHFCHEQDPIWAQGGVILSYMQMDDVARWRGTRPGRRGADYEAMKHEHAERLIDVVERHVPGLRASLARYHTSTPLTYYDYTGSEGGSMYGVAKDIHLGVACRVPHRTRVPNVLQTGQNINSHGMLGVLVGTMVTCGELIGSGRLYEQLNKDSE